MKHSKSHYKSITHNGYQWGGYDGNDMHFFTKEVKEGYRVVGYLELKCSEEDLTNGNFEFMADNGLTK
jgi:hypothetical protein